VAIGVMAEKKAYLKSKLANENGNRRLMVKHLSMKWRKPSEANRLKKRRKWRLKIKRQHRHD
jgi:hypothetical protein